MGLYDQFVYFKDISMEDLIIRKGHPIIEAGYKLSLNEQRIILLSLAKLDNRDINQKKVTLYVQEYIDAFNVDETIAYRDLAKASKRLYERSIILKDEDETTEFRWIESRTKYHKGEGRISFEFSNRVLPYLFELDKKLGYTQYQLLSISGFKSTYSIRMYELMKKIQKMHNHIIDIDEIRRMLQLEDKYPEFKAFNVRVLSVAIKEINAKSDLFVEVEKIKKGRKIIALKFDIKDKKESITLGNKVQKRPKFPPITHYKFAKLNKQDPKMSSSDYAVYANDCLKILDDFYNDIESITIEDLKYYYIFLAVNASHKSKLFGDKNAVYSEIQKRNYKLVNCELKELKND